ncbi:hypothetical protein BD779DRAFT_1678226 [Infundibulicybe gibba]|nr:hypothetical protein BD779DRAFT_1678226 [Infundibulicybe gibba]
MPGMNMVNGYKPMYRSRKQLPTGMVPDGDQADIITIESQPSIPDENEKVVGMEEPLSIGLAANVILGCLICVTCKIALESKHLDGHMQGNAHSNPRIIIDKAKVANACDELDIQGIIPALGKGPIHAIEGLAVFEDALKCRECGVLYRSQDSIKNHHWSNHQGIPLPPAWPTVSAQQLDKGTHKSYIEIHPIKDSSPPKPSYTDGINQLRQEYIKAVHKPFISLPLDPRSTSSWLRSTRWYEHVQGHSPVELQSLVSLPLGEELPTLKGATLDFLFRASGYIKKLPELVLQQLNTPDSAKTGVSNTPFQQHQNNDTTLQNYGLNLVKLLALLLRPKTNYNLVLPKELQDVLENLSIAESQRDMDAMQLWIHQVLLHLWTRTWSDGDQDTIQDPTICYLILHTLKKDGSFGEAICVTRIIAQLQYCMRLFFVFHIKMLAGDNKEANYIALSEPLIPWYTEKVVDSTFNSLRSLQHRATSAALETQGLPCIWWQDPPTYHTLLYRGHELNEMELAAMELWEKQVLCGLPLRTEYSSLTDDLRNKSVGYSFLRDTRNATAFPYEDMLINAVLGNENLRSKFVIRTDEETLLPIWNPVALRQWLYHYAQLQELELVMCQMRSGSPTRGTEMTCMQYVNTPTQPTRSLCMLGRHLAILCQYHKSSAITGHDKLIPHALDGFLSDLIIQDLSLARPFAQLAAFICFPQEEHMHRHYQTHLFVNQGKLFTTEDITRKMQAFTSPILGYGVGVNAWRHISTAYRRKLCHAMADLIEDDNNETIDALQAGHSRRTENRIYGLTAEALAGASEDLLPRFLEASTEWHMICGIVPGGVLLPYKQAVATNFKTLADMGHFTLKCNKKTQEIGGPTLLSEQSVQEIVSQTVALLQPTMIKMIKECIQGSQELFLYKGMKGERKRGKKSTYTQSHEGSEGNDDLEYVDALDLDSRAKSGFEDGTLVEPSSSPDVTEHSEKKNYSVPDSLTALRQLVKNDMAIWTCPEQQAGVQVALDHQDDLLAILPTGSGKTMLALIPALMERDMITIIVLPLRSLLADYKRKLEEMNMGYEHFDGPSTEYLSGQHNIILVSADMARLDHWRQCLAEVDKRRRVARLVFDEGHFSFTSNNFRPVLNRLYELRSLEMQMVIMSGTIPPQAEDTVKKTFGLGENTKVIRASSDRRELKYIVDAESKSKKEMFEKVAELIQDKTMLFSPEDRALVFVPFLLDGYHLAKMLKCEFYNGDQMVDDEQRQAMWTNWRMGKDPTMVCTSAFGAGNDYPSVRLVIHAGSPYDLVSWAQEAGRAGRDGNVAECYIMQVQQSKQTYNQNDIDGDESSQPQWMSNKPNNKISSQVAAEDSLDLKGRQALQNMLSDKNGCVRHHITAFMDGNGFKCESGLMGTEKCSRCCHSSLRQYPMENKHIIATIGMPVAITKTISKLPAAYQNSTSDATVWSQAGLRQEPTKDNPTINNIPTIARPLVKTKTLPNLLAANQNSASTASAAPFRTQANSHYGFQIGSASTALKRKSTSSDNPFATQARESKQRRIDHALQEDGYVRNFKKALSAWKGLCAYCNIYGQTRNAHSILKCPTLVKSRLTHDDYMGYRKSIVYREYHHKICYTCHIPQCSDWLHSQFQQGKPCEYADVLAPIGFAIFHQKHLCIAASKHFNTRWGTMAEYLDWINARPEVGHKSNLSALFLWYNEQKE